MVKETDNIELRSEKVRNIIGQIPPRIIRIGITLISIIILVILTGTYFFEYEYTIKTTATIEHKNDTITIIVKIPANEILKVKQGHIVVINFDTIPNLYNENLRIVIQNIPDKIEISKSGGYYITEIKLITTIITETGKELVINEKIEVNAEIITDKISFFDRILEPFKSLIKRKE
jgi:hypothetical protein